LYRARRYDEAIAQARQTLELDPDFAVARFWLESSLRHRGLFNEAVELRQSMVTADQAQIIARTFQHDGFQALLRKSGETFKKGGALVAAARYYAQSGDTDEAVALLEACAQRRCADLVSLNVEPDFDELRTNPRFQKLLRQIGLP
jgi:tetratricopeptide (TPR) repeat protein